VTVVRTGGGGGGGGGATALTMTSDVPDLPLLEAAILADPAEIPETVPFASTAATLSLFVDQVIDCPDMTAPNWSFTRATSDPVAPTSSDRLVGATPTVVATGLGGGSVTTLVPPLEHTTSCGMKRSQAHRAMLLILRNRFCTRYAPCAAGASIKC